MLAHVEIIQGKNKKYIHTLLVNGVDMSSSTTDVSLKITAGEIPEVIISLICDEPKFVGHADVKYDFTPKSVEQASDVLRTELLKHGVLYNGFLSSIMSAFRDAPDKFEPYDLAKIVLDRVIGEE